MERRLASDIGAAMRSWGWDESPKAASALDALLEGPEPEAAWRRLGTVVVSNPGFDFHHGDRLERLAVICSLSRALGQSLVRHPEWLDDGDVGSSPAEFVRRSLVSIVSDEARGVIDLEEATRRFSAVADQVSERALETARQTLTDVMDAASVPMAVIAMGKWGGQELNYSSDIDVVFVHDPGSDPAASGRVAQAVASRFIALLGTPGFEGRAFVVDADLRPEGAAGPLSRSLDAYRQYHERWAEPWEVQALIKARFAAGDTRLGKDFEQWAQTVVWPARGLAPGALRAIRRLRARADDLADPNDVKRGRGGIRDIEFTVQLLQLVHGRVDDALRVPGTLPALRALAGGGYLDEAEVSELTASYVWLRRLEHGLQLWDLRQTHVIPSNESHRERLARALQLRGDARSAFEDHLRQVRLGVRSLHERIYFRPVLDSLAHLPMASLDTTRARDRLEALGFTDVNAAANAIVEMMRGLTRRSQLMQQILPLMLDWLSSSPDPDLGLHQLRLLISNSPDHAPLIGLLQNNPVAGERLAILLGTGRYMGALIDRLPEFVPRLASEALLEDLGDDQAAAQRLLDRVQSREGEENKVGTIRRFVRRRRLRIAAWDVLGDPPVEETARALTSTADAAVEAALRVASGGEPDLSVVAMGKWGGNELSYESDLDLMFVLSDVADRDRGLQQATAVAAILGDPSPHGEAYRVDPGIRPEGKAGPLGRTVDSFAAYYADWAAAWEYMALIKARPAAGDSELGQRFSEIRRQAIWSRPLPEHLVREIRHIKARVESERIPPGEDPDYHLKLGPGGLVDVEFAVQLLQLRHGWKHDSIRTAGTIEAIDRLVGGGLLEERDGDALAEAYRFCTRVRMRLHLQRGRVTDSLPNQPRQLAALAASLGYDRAGDLRDDYRRATRRARRVFEAQFFDSQSSRRP